MSRIELVFSGAALAPYKLPAHRRFYRSLTAAEAAAARVIRLGYLRCLPMAAHNPQFYVCN